MIPEWELWACAHEIRQHDEDTPAHAEKRAAAIPSRKGGVDPAAMTSKVSARKGDFQRMKKLILAAALALALAPVTGHAQAQPATPAAQAPQAAPAPRPPLPDADPALWVVRDADTTI